MNGSLQHTPLRGSWLRSRAAGLLLGLLLAPAAQAVTITNTATLSYDFAAQAVIQDSNTLSLNTAIAPAPATVSFWQYSPNGSTQLLPAGGGQFDTGGGVFAPLGNPQSLLGNPIGLSQPVPVRETDVYHAGEPVFITLQDANRNQDPAVRETIVLTLSNPLTGDEETLELLETGPDTGVFAAVIPSVDAAHAVDHDGRISVDVNQTLLVHYQDPMYPDDTVDDHALVDPFGFVFDSRTGAPISGATVTVIDLATGQPAAVYGDDGTSAYPATVVTGGTVTDSSGQVYNLPAGGFRFPYMQPGNYRFVVAPPPGYTMPSERTEAELASDADTSGYAIEAGSYGDPFVVLPGPALHIDVPVDPPADPAQTLFLQKSASQAEASAGDFLRYTLTLVNRGATDSFNTVVTDTLPPGLRYRPGSLKVNGAPDPDPDISADGRTLTIPVGSVAPGATIQVGYVAQVVGRHARREAVNRAVAAGSGAFSNTALATVRIREPLMSGAFTLVGEVACYGPAPAITPPSCPPAVAPAPAQPTGTYTVRAQFDSGKATLKPAGKQELNALIAQLRGRDIERIELIGHTDSQRVGNPETLKNFKDNYGLSRARAQTVGDYLAQQLGLKPEQVSAIGRGPDQPVASNASAAGMAQNRRTEVQIFERQAASSTAAAACTETPASAPAAATDDVRRGLPNVRLVLDDGTYVVTDRDGLYHFEGLRPGTHVVQLDLDSLPPGARVLPGIQNTRFAGRSYSQFVEVGGGALWRADFQACAADAASEPAALHERTGTRDAIQDDATAAGGKTDWLAGAGPGIAWRFPLDGDSPRSPATRIVIQHAPEQTVTLSRDGVPVSELNFEGVKQNDAHTVAVSTWRGINLEDGDNHFVAEVHDASGAVVKTLIHTVSFAGGPARAELVPEESVLVADGIHRPVIAVRLLDRDGNPVRAGMGGNYQLNAPYLAWEKLEDEQRRQLAGSERFQPRYQVEGDRGIAYLELAPTTDSGAAVVTFEFQGNTGNFRSISTRTRRQEIRVWLESPPRDWLLVGFAEGTVGYNTLNGNAAALPPGTDEEWYSDGQVSVYAKGQVLGKWLLTLAYDSGKPDELERRGGLLSTIDPNQYYTLYGDGSGQRYDAPSQGKLYVKLERGQFYALFGDYDTGLTVTQLSRYSRTLNGFKTEYGANGPLTLTAFAADTAQNFVRDEIRGNGTSGLYHLSGSPIVINSEKIRIETRDRVQSQRIVQSRALARHLDYDIDYSAGTLLFRQPIASRDAEFNPQFIVAEYETFGAGDDELNAGGRAGVSLLDGRLSAGVSAVGERQFAGSGDLEGIDAKLRIGEQSELRVEAATSDGTQSGLAREGNAWLAEYEHHEGALDGLLYARRQEPGFGLNQQNLSESGTQKTGADAQYALTPGLSLRGQLWRQEQLASDATRDVAAAGVQYTTDLTTLRAGYQTAEDQDAAGASFESRQATFGAGRYFFGKRLELQANGDVGLGDGNQSVDFPSRYQLGASYALTSETRLLLAQEFTDGEAFDTAMTRIGLQLTPWQGARLNSTLNQQQISEYGPRTFAEFGLNQALILGERWSADLALDSSRTFNESGVPPFIPDPQQPATVTGGTLTDDYVAISGGLTWRDELWSWNGRAESRQGSTSDRYGVVSSFLRQAQAGVAFSASLSLFDQKQKAGASGRYGVAGLAWAWRPLGSRWSLLDKFELRYDGLENGGGLANGVNGALFGNTSLNFTGDAVSRRLVNNLALNRVSTEWTEDDRRGNLFQLRQRSQWSLYYGAKYSFDEYDGVAYTGYTDLLGFEWRHDLTRHWDAGLQASTLNSWGNRTHEYSAGPSIGWSPVVNGWLSIGYNVVGFQDRDFEAARYTAQGPYLKLRFKFDQNTRLRGDRSDPRAMEWGEYSGGPGRIGDAPPHDEGTP